MVADFFDQNRLSIALDCILEETVKHNQRKFSCPTSDTQLAMHSVTAFAAKYLHVAKSSLYCFCWKLFVSDDTYSS